VQLSTLKDTDESGCLLHVLICNVCVQEVYGEDPYLSGMLGAAYVKGMQGKDDRFVRTSSGCKVVGIYSGPENVPVSRFGFNANVCQTRHATPR